MQVFELFFVPLDLECFINNLCMLEMGPKRVNNFFFYVN